MAPAPGQDATQQRLAPHISGVREAARCRIEVCDGQHHPPRRSGDPGHLAEGDLRRVEVIERPLADHRVEAPGRERQGIRPTSQMQRTRIRLLGVQLARKRRHPGRRLRSHHQRLRCGQSASVLSETAGHVQNPPTRRGSREREGSLGHAPEQEFAITSPAGWDDVAHIPVEIDNPHDAAR